jgi:hypothetical protein
VAKGSNDVPAEPVDNVLSDMARVILRAAVTGQQQTVTMSKTAHGFNLGAGDQDLAKDDDDERKEAEYRAAVDELQNRGLIEDRWGAGNVFAVTRASYAAAGETQENEESKRDSPSYTHDDDIIVQLQGWMRRKFRGLRTPPISFAEVDRELNLPSGAAARLLERAAVKGNWVVDSSGPNLISFRHRRLVSR